MLYYNGIKLGATRFKIDDDLWHNYIFTWKNGEQNFYVDGKLRLRSWEAASDSEVSQVSIGWLGDQEGAQWEGQFSNIILFEAPISSRAVDVLYQSSYGKRKNF